jgi:hypothetical protein
VQGATDMSEDESTDRNAGTRHRLWRTVSRLRDDPVAAVLAVWAALALLLCVLLAVAPDVGAALPSPR